MTQLLLNKVAVITGAGSGIGRATAERFLAEGAKVVAFTRTGAPLEKIAARAPARVLAVHGDVTNPGDVGRLVTATTRRFGEVDVLIPCAGIARLAPFAESDPEEIEEQYRVNFLGAASTVREFLPHLNPSAAVIFITARLRETAGFSLGAFNATKAAVAALARSLALELAPRGIRVNCIAPGPTATPMWNKTGLPPKKAEELLGAMKRQSPGRKLADPADVADVALFLASDGARHIVGQELVVDGGFSIR